MSHLRVAFLLGIKRRRFSKNIMGDTEEKASSVTEETVQTSQEATGTPSSEAVKPSEEDGGEKSPKVDITKTPEFQKAWREEQSRRDKESKSLRERLDRLERERGEAEARAKADKLEKEYERQIDGEVEAGTVTEARGEYLKDWRRKWRDDFLATEKEKQSLKAERETWQTEKTNNALKLAIADVVEEAEKQGRVCSHSVAKKIAEDSEGNPKLIQFMVKNAPLEEETNEEDEGEIKAPASSHVSTAGGKKLRGDAALEAGLKEERKKLKL